MSDATVLVVDDVRIIRNMVKVNLELEGYRVIEAENGEEALKMIEEQKPNLVLLDVIMPFLDGFQVLEKIRQDNKTCSIPVVMLTNCVEEEDQIKGWEMGISEFITKPFNPSALVNVVNRVLNESHSRNAKEKRTKELDKLRIAKTIKIAGKDIL